MTGHELFLRLRDIVPQRHWEIYVLTEAYKFKAKEIAECLGLATGTVSNYLSIARKLVADESRKLTADGLSLFE
jgi:DNA-directed RNA polymerase specialized sigma24 family protein